MPNEVCQKCKGRGKTTKLDLMQAKTVMIDCPDCKGKGMIQVAPQTEGPRVGRIICENYFWQWLKGGKVVSTLEIRIRPIMGEDGKPKFKKAGPLSKLAIPRVYIEIVRMNTRPKHQKAGIMSKLLKMALDDPKIEWAESSWDDSTGSGRNFLLSRGFVQDGSKLIWRKPEEEPCQQ